MNTFYCYGLKWYYNFHFDLFVLCLQDIFAEACMPVLTIENIKIRNTQKLRDAGINKHYKQSESIFSSIIFPPYLGQDLVRCYTVRFDSNSSVRCRFTSQAKRTIQKSICQNLPPARSKVMC